MKNTGHQNSRIEQMLGVIRNLLDDIADMIELSDESLRFRAHLRVCKVDKVRINSNRDYEYLARRVRAEGIEFLTTTLPRLGKWYDDLLAETATLPTAADLYECRGFAPYKEVMIGHFRTISDGLETAPYILGRIRVPRFLSTYYYVLQALDTLPLTARARIIRAYRTLFYLFYKLEVPVTKEAERLALENWARNEEEISNWGPYSFYDSDLHPIRDIIASVVGHDESVYKDIHCAHGRGAVAGGEKGEEKFKSFNLIPTLHRVYPRYDLYFGFRSLGRINSHIALDIVNLVKRSKVQEAVSRLLFVPKDSRGPRTICCEPKELMFVQQGIMRNLQPLIEHNTRNRINFIDQSINARLARLSSASSEYGTVDMKDASDRVSWELVKSLWPEEGLKYLEATRSHSTMLPDGSVVKHYKYAPMGSALCFPIESVIFWAAAVHASIKSGMSASDARRHTYAFGDDLIIHHTCSFDILVRIMTKLGLLLNKSKSYVCGPFRESCGTDAYYGEVVTPLRIKKDLFGRTLDGPLALACCDYSSAFFDLGLRKTGEFMYNLVNNQYPGVVRYYKGNLPCLHVVDPLSFDDKTIEKGVWNNRTQTINIEGWCVTTPKTPSSLNSLERLLKYQYGDWAKRDPNEVVAPHTTKIRKRRCAVGLNPTLFT